MMARASLFVYHTEIENSLYLNIACCKQHNIRGELILGLKRLLEYQIKFNKVTAKNKETNM